VKTVLFVGAGRHQRRAILHAKQLGLRVVAVDRNPEAVGLPHADDAHVVDFAEVEAVIAVARAAGIDGVLTVSADRAVPVVAAVAEELGLPGIGSATAHLMTHKVAMRRRLAEGGVPQPRFAAVRVRREAAPAADTVGFPAVLKPADSGGQRGLFQLRSFEDLDRHLHAALAESPSDEVILEEFVDGLELNGLVVDVAARVPGGQMADLAFHALGVDLIEIALKQALGEEAPDEIVLPRYSRPTAIRFLTARPGPLPLGKVRKVSGLDRVLQAPGVVQADVFLQPGETIRPVRLDGDRRGYVIATGQTNVQALERAEAAARLLYVETE